MKRTTICSNPSCSDVAPHGQHFRYGLCPSCEYSLRRGLYFGGVIGGLLVTIGVTVFKIISAVIK